MVNGWANLEILLRTKEKELEEMREINVTFVRDREAQQKEIENLKDEVTYFTCIEIVVENSSLVSAPPKVGNPEPLPSRYPSLWRAIYIVLSIGEGDSRDPHNDPLICRRLGRRRVKRRDKRRCMKRHSDKTSKIY